MKKKDSCVNCEEYAGCGLIRSLAVGFKNFPLLDEFLPGQIRKKFQVDMFKILPKYCCIYGRKK